MDPAGDVERLVERPRNEWVARAAKLKWRKRSRPPRRSGEKEWLVLEPTPLHASSIFASARERDGGLTRRPGHEINEPSVGVISVFQPALGYCRGNGGKKAVRRARGVGLRMLIDHSVPGRDISMRIALRRWPTETLNRLSPFRALDAGTWILSSSNRAT